MGRDPVSSHTAAEDVSFSYLSPSDLGNLCVCDREVGRKPCLHFFFLVFLLGPGPKLFKVDIVYIQ